MLFTPIHEALGLQPESLSVEIIMSAIQNSVKEERNLDWKTCLPQLGEKPDWGQEFAKDVAAMANSGGGIIVFGVKEDGNAGAKEHIPMNLGDSDRNTLLAIAFSNIEPKVLGVNFVTVGDGDSSVVVLNVPNSKNAPHFINSKKFQGHLVVPIRYGAKTEYVSGETLSNMFRAKHEGERGREEQLNEALISASEDAASLDEVSLIAVAKPTNPSLERLDVDRMIDILSSARSIRGELYESCAGKIDGFDKSSPLGRLRGHNGALEYRKLVESKGFVDIYDIYSEVELHFDGSITLKSSVGGIYKNDSGKPFNPKHLEAFSIDLVSLVLASSANLKIWGSYDIGLTIKEAKGKPVQMKFSQAGESPITFKRLKPAKTEIWSGATITHLRHAAQELTLDIINQGGRDYLSILR